MCVYVCVCVCGAVTFSFSLGSEYVNQYVVDAADTSFALKSILTLALKHTSRCLHTFRIGVALKVTVQGCSDTGRGTQTS